MKRQLIGILSALLVVSVVLISNVNVHAKEREDEPLSEELQIKENEANKQYCKLLEAWAYNKDYLDDVNAKFPDFYGGSYIDDKKQLVIQVTNINDKTIEYFENIIDTSNVKFETVQYSFYELKKAHDEIADKMNPKTKDMLISNISGVGISFPDNMVSLYLVHSEKFADIDSYKEAIRKYLTAFDGIKIVFTDEKDQPASSVEPGSAIKNSGYTRSVGFWAKNGSGDLGIVTAPHSSISSGTTMKIGTRTFGTAGTPHYSGSVDAVFVKRTNTYFNETRYVSGWGFNLNSNSYAVHSVGATIYSKGEKSGRKTGTVLDVNYTTSYGISNCVLTSATCADGDSGGIVAGAGNTSNRNVSGIITGKQGSTNYLIYVKAGNILSTLGLSVY